MTDKTDYGEPLRTEYNERTKRWEVKSADDTIGFVYCGIDERFRIERYIACVNACAGIPTEVLEADCIQVDQESWAIANLKGEDLKRYVDSLKARAAEQIKFLEKLRKFKPDADPD